MRDMKELPRKIVYEINAEANWNILRKYKFDIYHNTVLKLCIPHIEKMLMTIQNAVNNQNN